MHHRKPESPNILMLKKVIKAIRTVTLDDPGMTARVAYARTVNYHLLSLDDPRLDYLALGHICQSYRSVAFCCCGVE